MGRRLKQLLREGDLVLELWWDREGREFACLASAGHGEARGHQAGHGRTLRAAVDDAVVKLGMGEIDG